MLYSCILLQSERELNLTIKLVDLSYCTNLFKNLAYGTYFISDTLGMCLQWGTESRKI